MRNLKYILFFLITTLFMISMSSCLTLCDSLYLTHYQAPPLAIMSDVEGADVYINGKYYGKSDCYYYPKKDNTAEVSKITLKKAGYKDKTIKTKRKIRREAYLNFMPFPLYNFIWGFFVDMGRKEYTEDTYIFYLEKK